MGRRCIRGKSEDLQNKVKKSFVRGKRVAMMCNKLFFATFMKKGLWMLVCCICFLCMPLQVLPVAAQIADVDTMADNSHYIGEVTVTARHPYSQITSTVPSQSLSGQDISRLGIQNMADAVRRFAGANVRDYGGIGGMKTVSVRNMGAAHTAVSYDGVTVSNCQAGQIDIGRFSVDNVSVLSLSVGQTEDMLQTARHYASAAVLDIETERPSFAEGRISAFRFMLCGASFGYVKPSLRWWQRLGRRTTLSLDADFMRADGNYPFTLVNGVEVTQERRNNSDVRSGRSEVNLYHSLRSGGELSAKAYYYRSNRGLPGSVTLYNSISHERLWDENFFVQSAFKKDFSRMWSLRAYLKYNHSWTRYEDTNVKYEDGKQTDVHRQDEYYASVIACCNPMQGFSVALAQDVVGNTLHNNINQSPNPVRLTTLTALTVRYSWRRLVLQGNVVGTYVTEHVHYGSAPDDRKRLSPTVALSYRLWEDHDFFVRAFYKNTFRVPTFNDLYYLRIGNVSLRPEKAKEYNIGATWSGSAFPLQLSATVDAYYNSVTDKIVAYPSTYVWRMANFGKVHIHGIDATVSVSAPLRGHCNVLLTSAYTWQKAIDLTDPDAKNYRHQLPYTPRHSGNIALQLLTSWVDAAYTLTASGKRYALAQNTQENLIDSYVEHTVSLSRSFAMRRCSLRVQAELVNLTDTQYEIIKYYPMPGRSWRLTGTVSF